MNLKGLVHRELGEGLAEEDLASAVGVSVRMIANILADKLPPDPTIWEQFARYFRTDVDFLRTGESAHRPTLVKLSEDDRQPATIELRKVPLLTWHRLAQIVTSKNLSDVVHSEALVETTNVSGPRTFALTIKNDSMEPLFKEGEMIFVNPDLEWRLGDYVIVNSRDAVLLRQVIRIGSRCVLHPLNRKYDNLPLTEQDEIWGKVVRLRKNL